MYGYFFCIFIIYHTVYYLGVYNSFDEPEKVLPNAVEKIYTYYSGFCYELKINYTLPKIDTGNFLTCKLSFNKSISYTEEPRLTALFSVRKRSADKWLITQNFRLYWNDMFRGFSASTSKSSALHKVREMHFPIVAIFTVPFNFSTMRKEA